MKRVVTWLADNADAVIGLAMAIVASILGILETIPAYVIGNVTVLTLATLAFVMLRDRHRAEKATRNTERLMSRGGEAMLDLFAQLQEKSTVRIIDRDEIRLELDDSRKGTNEFTFKGATGTFTRTVALPDLIEVARKDNGDRGAGKRLAVRIGVFDPGNDRLLGSYVELYKSWSSGPDDPVHQWSVDGTRQEILATILAACLFRGSRSKMLNIEVRLFSDLTTFRWDLTDSTLIITQRGPRFPAVRIARGDPIYKWWARELHQSMDAAKLVPFDKLDRTNSLKLGEIPTPAAVRDLFQLLEVPIPKAFNDEQVTEIIDMALSTEDPYGESAEDPGRAPGMLHSW